MTADLETIQSFVAPVVMVSANGLLCLAFYNRMSAVMNRTREINRERFELIGRLSSLRTAGNDAGETAHLARRVEVLDQLGHRLIDAARLLRGALFGLLASVLAMLACSLALGLMRFYAWFGQVAQGLFVVGVLAMMVGIVQAIRELSIVIEPLLFEHEEIEGT